MIRESPLLSMSTMAAMVEMTLLEWWRLSVDGKDLSAYTLCAVLAWDIFISFLIQAFLDGSYRGLGSTHAPAAQG